MICLFKDTHSSLEISMLLIAPTDFYLVACYREVSLTCCLFFSASGKFQFTLPLQESRKLVSLHLCIWDQKKSWHLQSPLTKLCFNFLLLFHSESMFMDLFKYKNQFYLHNKQTDYWMTKTHILWNISSQAKRIKCSLQGIAMHYFPRHWLTEFMEVI